MLPALKKLLFCLVFLLSYFVQADVVKPALVEISLLANNRVEVVIDLSLEAVMSGIGTQYKNTKDAPNAADYDELRELTPALLQQRFKAFAPQFLASISLSINGKKQDLKLQSAKIDIKGYTKRPRKTILTYFAQLQNQPVTLQWQYAKTYGDSALRYQLVKKDEYNWSQWQWLKNGKSSGVIEIEQPQTNDATGRFTQFINIGFEHVIPKGWDHILFIVGMALSSLLWRRLLILVSGFTFAHTLTLGLAMFGVVEIPARIIEPLIAFSIAYVAIENLLPKSSPKRQSVLVFLFGLVHGLGFASMLKDFDMPANTFVITLIGFNIGVELAQIVLVFGVVLPMLILQKLQLNYQRFVVIPISVMIAVLGLVWGIERLTA